MVEMVLVARRARKRTKRQKFASPLYYFRSHGIRPATFCLSHGPVANIYLISKSESEVKKRQSTNTTNKHKPRKKKTVAYLQFFRLVP